MKNLKLFLIFIFCFLLFATKISASNKTLEDGVYTISSAINKEYVFDINQGIVSNGSNIQLYKSNFSEAQKFKITYLEDGTYQISPFSSNNYSIDISGGIFKNSSNIQLYSSNNSNAQKWIIKDAGDGYFTIFSTDENFCIDVSNGVAVNGSNVQLYSYNGSLAQKFRFDQVSIGKKSIEDGIYTISSALNENKSLDMRNGIISNYNGIQLYDTNLTDAQKWFVNYLGDGTYSIKAYLDINYSMDVYNASKTNGTNLQIFSYNKSDAQKWIIKDVGNGYYSIISLCNNLSLDVYNASTINGTKIQLYESNGTNAQKFKFNEVKEVGSKTINDGYYFIGSSLNNNKVLDIANGTIAQNTNVQIYDINSSLAQKWYIKYQNNGYYKMISNKNENYCLEVENSGTNVQIATCNGNNNQNWIIKKTYDNNYYIINENGFYLDLYLTSLVNGTNIGTFEGNGTKAQKFNFIKTAQGISSKVISNGFYRIVSALDNNMVLDLYNGFSSNGTNVQLYKSNGSNAQKFEVTYLDYGYYKISSMLDLTKSFDVASAGTANGTNVQIYDNNNSLAQQWVIKDAGNGYFYIISNCNGLYLDVANGSATNGVNVWMYEKNESKAQKFKFVKTEEKTKVVDVSYHQGTIDWNKVYNSGIYGVILRIGYWNTEDGKFSEYINEVKRLGMPYGIYIFSYANTTNGAGVEANFTNNIISKYNLNPTLGIYYDLEDWYLSADNTSNTLSKEQYDDIARTYINTVSQYVGSKYKVKIYADLNHVNNIFGDYARSESDWIAHYGVSSCGYKGPHSLWQYTSEATLDGIRGYVDMNYLY